MPYTVLLVRSENVAWHGLHEALARERRGDIHVLAAVDSAPLALTTAARTCPDLVLTRAPMPDMDLRTFARTLHQVCPRVRLIIVPDEPSTLTAREPAALAT